MGIQTCRRTTALVICKEISQCRKEARTFYEAERRKKMCLPVSVIGEMILAKSKFRRDLLQILMNLRLACEFGTLGETAKRLIIDCITLIRLSITNAVFLFFLFYMLFAICDMFRNISGSCRVQQWAETQHLQHRNL